MSCKSEDSYLVRVLTKPTDSKDAVLIYTAPVAGSSKPARVVDGFAFAGTRTLCFKEDPASTAKGLTISLVENRCKACSNPNWGGDKVLSVDVSPPLFGDGGELLLKAVSADNRTYTAETNPPQINGGRPIIRNPFGFVIVATVVAVVLVTCVVIMKRKGLLFRPAG